MTLVRIDTRRIVDWPSFHAVFREAFGFPDFYGDNLDAWIDCMTDLDAPATGMTTVHVARGEALALRLDDVDAFAARCPAIYAALVECAAFVNWRRIEAGAPPVLALAFHRGA